MKTIAIDTNHLSWYFTIAKDTAWNIVTNLRHLPEESSEPQGLQVPYSNTPIYGAYNPSETFIRGIIDNADYKGSYVLYVKERDSENAFIVDNQMAKLLLGVVPAPKGIVTYDDLIAILEESNYFDTYQRLLTLSTIKERKAVKSGHRTFTLFWLKEKYDVSKLTPAQLKKDDRAKFEMLATKSYNLEIAKRKGKFCVRIALYPASKHAA